MSRIHHLPMLGLIAILASCSSLPEGARPVSAVYCDNFLIYDMCAQDLNSDGVVELVYFTETREVFMFREGAQRRVPRHLDMHRCARPMDEDLVATTSRLFFIDDDTPFLQKQDIRGSMMLKYVSYMPEVTACNMRHEQASAESSSL